jgi:hypothetical protein
MIHVGLKWYVLTVGKSLRYGVVVMEAFSNVQNVGKNINIKYMRMY